MACTTPTIAATITRKLGDTYSKVYLAVSGDDGALLTSGEVAAFTSVVANVRLASVPKADADSWALSYEAFTAPGSSSQTHNLSYLPTASDLVEPGTYYLDIVMTTAGGAEKPTAGVVRILVEDSVG